jgi:hypothetical protein
MNGILTNYLHVKKKIWNSKIKKALLNNKNLLINIRKKIRVKRNQK